MRHDSINHSSKSKRRTWNCDLCEKTFNRSDNLSKHLRVHGQIPKSEDFKCEPCNKTFFEKRNLNCHNISFHGDVKFGIKCNYCPKIFAKKRFRKTHS